MSLNQNIFFETNFFLTIFNLCVSYLHMDHANLLYICQFYRMSPKSLFVKILFTYGWRSVILYGIIKFLCGIVIYLTTYVSNIIQQLFGDFSINNIFNL